VSGTISPSARNEAAGDAIRHGVAHEDPAHR
jgi:hypothetical protein